MRAIPRVIFTLIVGFLLFSCSHNRNSIKLVDLAPGESKEDHEAYAKKLMVTTQGNYSTEAGLEVFRNGGNIFDVAVAVSFALAVERPQSTGIGGGGFLLFKEKDGGVHSIDFREMAPLRSSSKMYLDNSGEEIKGKSVNGIFAVGVPGFVKGLSDLHGEKGKLPLSQVLAPAIRLAREGFIIYPELGRALKYKENTLKKFKGNLPIFFNSQGEILKAGDRLVQEDLAQTLESIGRSLGKSFYEGKIAKKIIKESNELGGILSLKDLKNYEVKKRRPVKGKYKDFEIYSMAPPSSGGIHILQILNIVEKDNLKKWGPQNPKSIHLISGAMQRAFADRGRYLGDADFVKVPVQGLLSKSYAQSLRSKMNMSKAQSIEMVSFGNPLPYESSETTHFSLMDNEGNVVVSTQTINGWFGSGVMVRGAGILLNNEMDDFATKVGASNIFGAYGGANNLVEPKKRPLSSMSPTIVLKKGVPVLALGSPSGTRILTCVAQTILNYIEFKLPLYESVAAIRYHHQWSPDLLRIEEKKFSENVMNKLKNLGHKIQIKNLGCKVQAIAFKGDRLHGVSDPRGHGLAKGL